MGVMGGMCVYSVLWDNNMMMKSLLPWSILRTEISGMKGVGGREDR